MAPVPRKLSHAGTDVTCSRAGTYTIDMALRRSRSLVIAAFSAAVVGAAVAQGPAQAPLSVPRDDLGPGVAYGSRAFYFARAAYTDGRRRFRGLGAWATDYPKADRQFLIGLTRLTRIDADDDTRAIRLDDPNLRRYPLIYTVEVGAMQLTEPEVDGLRSYLLAGGMLVVDDFWGVYQWATFEQEIRRVLPEYTIRELPPDHPVRLAFYSIEEIVQVPNVGQGCRGGNTSESGGITPHLMGIEDEHGRLMVLISFNSDLGDAWEWAEQPCYPLPFSNYAYRIGVNMVVYGMSH